MEKDPGRPSYVGEPSKAIDEAWDKLLDSKSAILNCDSILTIRQSAGSL
jgi:hypothetical protein